MNTQVGNCGTKGHAGEKSLQHYAPGTHLPSAPTQ